MFVLLERERQRARLGNFVK